MPELSDAVHAEIKRSCAEGDSFVELENYPAALRHYWEAWDLLPEPREDWEAATWILAAIGDTNFLNRDFVAGRDNLSNAMRCPGAIGNAFLHLRLGQCQFELGNLDRAAAELLRAYAVEGRELFEPDNPKYLEFLATRAKGIETKRPWWRFWRR